MTSTALYLDGLKRRSTAGRPSEAQAWQLVAAALLGVQAH